MHEIHNADILEWCAGYKGERLHAVLCDPPYELSFMGKSWDSTGIAFDPKTWRAIADQLYPGAYLLAFGGTRTVHRIAVAIEDAGFEIRDTVMWAYGSGFPKSHDVSKAIDKRGGVVAGMEEFQEYLVEKIECSGVKKKTISEALGNDMLGHYIGKSQRALPNRQDYLKLKEVLGLDNTWDNLFREEVEREVVGVTEATYGYQKDGVRWDKEHHITTAKTDQAKRWSGYGSALKPAYEPIIIARLPLEGTIAQNAQKYGSGALNIDGSRIGTSTIQTNRYTPGHDMTSFHGSQSGNDYVSSFHLGRWPANLIHDNSPEVVGMFPNSKAGKNKEEKGTGGIWNKGTNLPIGPEYGDDGSAARFFKSCPLDDPEADIKRLYYSAKVSKSERDAGLEGTPISQSRGGGEGKGNPDLEKVAHAYGSIKAPAHNFHPTLKPLSLTKYLATLILPPKLDQPRRLLVPFSGAGSEVIGALQAGWDEVVGVEQSKEYVEIAEARIKHWTRESKLDL